jgi:carboxymethylenebutenolidase
MRQRDDGRDGMGEFTTIESDGGSWSVYEAGSGSAGVLVLHPWWGLNADVVAYADRLADAGFAVSAPDMFDGQVATTIEGAETLARGADEDTINGIVLATLDRLATRVGPDARLAVLGFSFGAHWTMWIPTQRDRVVASILYYGTTDGPHLQATKVPVLGHFAEDDPFESAEWVAEFEGILRAAGRDVVFHRYPDTGHWFAEPSRDAYRPEAAELAFERTVAFLRAQLG